MNLGNQNIKYSWRIRDLENPQTGTQFANSVLMYKMIDDHIYVNNHKIDKKRHDQSTNFEFFQSTNTSVDARKYCLL